LEKNENETTHHKGKQEERQAGRQDRRQDHPTGGHLRKALRTLNSTLHCLKKMQNQTTNPKGKQEERQVGRQAGGQEGRQTGRQGRQNLGKADTPSNTGTRVGRRWEISGDKAH